MGIGLITLEYGSKNAGMDLEALALRMNTQFTGLLDEGVAIIRSQAEIAEDIELELTDYLDCGLYAREPFWWHFWGLGFRKLLKRASLRASCLVFVGSENEISYLIWWLKFILADFHSNEIQKGAYMIELSDNDIYKL